MSSATYFPLWGSSKGGERSDIESGLYPGIGETEQILRLGYATLNMKDKPSVGCVCLTLYDSGVAADSFVKYSA